MLAGIKKAAEIIRKHRGDLVEIISHMDADGVCAAAIMSRALDRENVEHRVKFVRMLYRDVVEKLDPAPLTIFTDLGSSQLENLRQSYRSARVIICDHHPPQRVDGLEGLVHLNAYEMGMDGLKEISGAGMAFLLARELNRKNSDLSALAVIGAIGDIQNAWGKLSGSNREILNEGMRAKVLDRRIDLQLYGRYTKPLFQSLESFSDPPIEGVTNSSAGCMELIRSLGIPVKGENGWRRLADLSEHERRMLATELISRALSSVPEEFIPYVPNLIVGECYTILGEDENSELRDAGEFATCLNSTARHEQPLIGLEVAKGDRGAYYRAMLNLLHHHRRAIARGMEFIETEGLKVGDGGYLQYFDATGVVKETFVGTLASLSLGSRVADPYKPVVGTVREGGMAKVSARCSKLLFLRGLDLAAAIKEAAEEVGGEGGGHPIASGAQVEEERISEFLHSLEQNILRQL